MTRIQQTKAAIDFAFNNYQSDAIAQAEASINTFKAAGGKPADLALWNQTVQQFTAQAAQLSKQKLPSDVTEAQVAAQVQSTNAATVSQAAVA